jgi:hypothetical protein
VTVKFRIGDGRSIVEAPPKKARNTMFDPPEIKFYKPVAREKLTV